MTKEHKMRNKQVVASHPRIVYKMRVGDTVPATLERFNATSERARVDRDLVRRGLATQLPDGQIRYASSLIGKTITIQKGVTKNEQES